MYEQNAMKYESLVRGVNLKISLGFDLGDEKSPNLIFLESTFNLWTRLLILLIIKKTCQVFSFYQYSKGNHS